MKGFKRVGLVAAVVAVTCLPAGTAGAATPAAEGCGNTGRITNITASGTTCSKAKAVARRWKRLCNYAGRCAVEGGGVGGQWVCKGKRSGSRLNEKCTRGAGTVKFRSPA